MTISSSLRKAGPFTGNDVATTFTFSFKVFTDEDIYVAYNDGTTETVLTQDSDYSVSLNADQDDSPGGTVTYPVSGSPLGSSEKLVIAGSLEELQGVDLENGGAFNAVVVENAFDYLTILIQQLSEVLARTFKVNVTSGVSAELPPPEGGKSFGWNALGTAIVNYALQTGTSLVDLAVSTGSSIIGFLQAGTGAVARTVQSKLREVQVSVTDFGAVGGGANDTTAFANAVAKVSTVGGAVVLPPSSGLYGINTTQTMPDRVRLQGENCRASGLKALPPFTGTYMLNYVSGSNAMFDCSIRDLTLNCNDIAGFNGILSDAWQEQSGLYDSLIQKFRGYGIAFQNGYGGASSCVIEHSEIFGSESGSVCGVFVAQISVVGAFKLTIRDTAICGGTPAGMPTSALARGVQFVNDSSTMDNVRFETTGVGVYLDGVGNHVLNMVQGAVTVTTLVEIASTFTGTLVMNGCTRNGATNFIVDNRTGGVGTITGYDPGPVFVLPTKPSLAATVSHGLTAANTAKAAAVFDGTGAGPYLPDTAAMSNSFNITSITKTGTGRYRATMTRANRTANCIPIGMTNDPDATVATQLVGATTVDILTNKATVATDFNEIKLIVTCP